MLFINCLQSGDRDQDAADEEASFNENTLECEVDVREQTAEDDEMLVLLEGAESVGDVLDVNRGFSSRT